MVSLLSLPPAAVGTVSTTGNKIAKLAQLHLQLSACEEQLGAVERQYPSPESRARDKQIVTFKIAAIKEQIAELARSAESPTARAAEDDQERQRADTHSAERSPLDAVRLALVKEGHLGTLVNLRV
jgi:hypothetical protein